jgi:hypothetical protein
VLKCGLRNKETVKPVRVYLCIFPVEINIHESRSVDANECHRKYMFRQATSAGDRVLVVELDQF